MKHGWPFALLLPVAIACGSSSADPTTNETDIIGGARASGQRLDAIGSLAAPLDPRWEPAPTGSDGGLPSDAGVDASADDDTSERPPTHRVFCSATLVAPKVVLTAKHCVRRKTAEEVWFNLGPDGTRPTRSVRAASVHLASLDQGGFVDLGSDVAVIELAEEVRDVTPLPILGEALSERAVGARVSAVGFGIRDKARTFGQRLAGTLTVRATEGAFAQKLFGSLEELVKFASDEGGAAFDSYSDPTRLDTDFWREELIPSYETFVGLAEGDAQPCSGDSGGPLLARMKEDLVVVGVVSGSFKLSNSYANPCSVLGEVYATFGPVVQTLFDEVEGSAGQKLRRVALDAIAEGSAATLPTGTEGTDPPDNKDDLEDAGPASDADGGSDADASTSAPVDRCRGLTSSGICKDGVVLRCIAPEEGPARATRTDCTLLFSTCGVSKDGTAACVDL